MINMTRIYVILSFLTVTLIVSAQTSVKSVLQSVEANNKELKAGEQQVVAAGLESRLGNNLADPTVTYSHQYGNHSGLGTQDELIASQSFDFPTVYSAKRNLSNANDTLLNHNYSLLRQQILLRARCLCINLVYYNKMKSLLAKRESDAKELTNLYDRRLEKGSANAIETNKIALELLNATEESRRNENNRISALRELQALNGDIAIAFNDTDYIAPSLPLSVDELLADALPLTPSLQSYYDKEKLAAHQVSVKRAMNLPGFEVGYRLNTVVGGQRYNGFLVGVSIPLFSNRNHVRQARAQQTFAKLETASAVTTEKNRLISLYDKSVSLHSVIDQYAKALDMHDNLPLLMKALQLGQINLTEYFSNAATRYQSLSSFLELQRDYQLSIAEMLRYKE